MQSYTKQHKYYCGIDLHTKKMFISILDVEGRRHQGAQEYQDGWGCLSGGH